MKTLNIFYFVSKIQRIKYLAVILFMFSSVNCVFSQYYFDLYFSPSPPGTTVINVASNDDIQIDFNYSGDPVSSCYYYSTIDFDVTYKLIDVSSGMDYSIYTDHLSFHGLSCNVPNPPSGWFGSQDYSLFQVPCNVPTGQYMLVIVINNVTTCSPNCGSCPCSGFSVNISSAINLEVNVTNLYGTPPTLPDPLTPCPQQPPMTLIDNSYDPSSGYNDIWGYADDNGNEYAILAAANRTYFVDITDPYNPVEVDFIPGPSSTHRDIKTYTDAFGNSYAYIVTEGTGAGEGLQVVDLSNLPTSVTLVNTWTSSNFTHAHNLFIDEPTGRLVLCGGDMSGPGIGGMLILDIATDPANPAELLPVYNNLPVHDLYIKGNMLLACANSLTAPAGSDGIIKFFDISSFFNISTPNTFTELSTHTWPDGRSHSVWTTEDGKLYGYSTRRINTKG
ncbi:MAG: choice-of-anchor B family protein [Cytophagales bacterium]|nr:choice-of-anchor B family protein [Cytophagales bacterium]